MTTQEMLKMIKKLELKEEIDIRERKDTRWKERFDLLEMKMKIEKLIEQANREHEQATLLYTKDTLYNYKHTTVKRMLAVKRPWIAVIVLEDGTEVSWIRRENEGQAREDMRGLEELLQTGDGIEFIKNTLEEEFFLDFNRKAKMEENLINQFTKP